MDARSIAATARNHGALTAATEIEYEAPPEYSPSFSRGVYEKRVYFGFGKAKPETPLRFGPNIAEWPAIPPLPQNLLLELACVIHDPVTTTDELIPSGEASSYRSNPLKLAGYTLSRRDPEYSGRAKRIQSEALELAGGNVMLKLREIFGRLGLSESEIKNSGFGSAIFANKPGDGSAREQAASCQRVLGGSANICYEYATKRYRSNCINWGIVPFTIDKSTEFNYKPGDYIYVPALPEAVLSGKHDIPAKILSSGVNEITLTDITLYIEELTEEERQIIAEGCLMNYYAAQRMDKK
jgi:aconitate hydratase